MAVIDMLCSFEPQLTIKKAMWQYKETCKAKTCFSSGFWESSTEQVLWLKISPAWVASWGSGGLCAFDRLSYCFLTPINLSLFNTFWKEGKEVAHLINTLLVCFLTAVHRHSVKFSSTSTSEVWKCQCLTYSISWGAWSKAHRCQQKGSCWMLKVFYWPHLPIKHRVTENAATEWMAYGAQHLWKLLCQTSNVQITLHKLFWQHSPCHP